MSIGKPGNIYNSYFHLVILCNRSLGPLFDTVDDKITYVRQQGFKAQLRDILEQHQRFDELAEEYLHEDDLDRGVRYYVEGYQCHHTTSSIVHAVELALGYVESVLLIEGVYRKSSYDLARSLITRVQPFAGQADSESCRAVSLTSTKLRTVVLITLT